MRILLSENEVAICILNGVLDTNLLNQLRIPVATEEKNIQFEIISKKINELFQSEKIKPNNYEWILGLEHVRYLVIPWHNKLATQEFRDSITNNLFVQKYRDEISRYEVSFSKLNFGHPLIAAFVSKELIQGITSINILNKSKNVKITPLLIPIWNKLEKTLRQEHSFLYVWDGNRALKIENKYGQIASIELEPFNHIASENHSRKDNMLVRHFPNLKPTTPHKHSSSLNDPLYALVSCGAY